MALLDVSELMWDPDFCDEFTYVRNFVTINNYGEAVQTPTTLTAYGSIQPINSRTYDIFPDLTRISGSLECYTTTALTCVSTNPLASDLVLWNGLTYVVQAISSDYSNWGGGHYVAVLALQDLLSADPGTLPSTSLPV
jgi:hypothetical protein